MGFTGETTGSEEPERAETLTQPPSWRCRPPWACVRRPLDVQLRGAAKVGDRYAVRLAQGHELARLA